MADWKVPGAALAVLQDGKVVKMKIADVTNRADALQWATARFARRGLPAQ